MSEPKKKPGVAFWATVVVVVALMYPISFGPACWITSHARIGAPVVSVVYQPIIWAWDMWPEFSEAIDWYARVFAQKDWRWSLDNEWTDYQS